MFVVVMTAFVMVEVVIRSNLIYILLGGGMCGVCSCGGVIVGYSVSSLTKAAATTATTTTPPPILYHHHNHHHPKTITTIITTSTTTNFHYNSAPIPIVPFTMCDDLLVVSECGFKTNLVVSYINSQARFNYLQFGITKCSKVHIGKTTPVQCTP